MTRERDRIQENANKYIVKNCPCLFNSYYASGKTVRFECNDGNHDDKLCRDVTDCVVKQVIEMCKKEAVINYPKKEKEFITVNGYQAILNIFDIEEVK